MGTSSAGGGDDGLDAELRRFTDDARASASADARRREASLRRQAAEEGTMAGVLLDLAERDQLVSLVTVAGRTLRGLIRTVGVDFVGLRGPAGEGSLVPMASITAVRTEPDAGPSVGDRVVEVDSPLRGVLADLATQRPWVAVHTRAADSMSGQLSGVGRDVLSVRGENANTIYVPLTAIADIVLP